MGVDEPAVGRPAGTPEPSIADEERLPSRTAAEFERHQIVVYLVALALGAGGGLVFGDAGTALEPAINPVIAALLFVTFLQVPFTELSAAFRGGRFLAAVLALNFAVVPAVVAVLTWPLRGQDALLLGALLVLLCPCVDYVIVFSRLAGGAYQGILAAAPLLMLVQLLLLPAYLWLFFGGDLTGVVDPQPFIEAFTILIVLPLAAAWAAEVWGARTKFGAAAVRALGVLPVPLMALTLLVVVASQVPGLRNDLQGVLPVLPVYAGFLLVMLAVGRAAARFSRLDVPAGRALVFSGATRNSLVVLPLALALPAQYALVPVVVITQTLVELAGMLVYVNVVPRLLPQRRPHPDRPSSTPTPPPPEPPSTGRSISSK